ncbi:MAG: Flp family type IVb pilin [Bacillota bacterium]
MRSPRRLLATLARDEHGSETMEYSLIVGLIIVAALVVCTTIGSKVFGRWEPSGDR